MGILEGLLDCDLRDIQVIEAINEELIEEAIDDIKMNAEQIDMPSLFYSTAQIAIARLDISPDDVEVDCNYCCASISISDTDKISKKKIKKLEELGFTVYY